MSSLLKTDQSESLKLTPILGERWVLRPKHLFITVWFGGLFLYCNHIPLFHTDLWGHVSYGNWILEHRALPQGDPFVRLTEGVPIVDTAWLGQVVLSVVERTGGAEGISHLFAFSILAIYLILARTFFLQTGRCGLATAGVILAWIIAWSRHAIARPEIFGGLCFALLLWMLCRMDTTRSQVAVRPSASRHPSLWTQSLGISLLFAAWANLHGSFVVGLGVLGCYLLGRSVEVLWTSRSVIALLQDRLFRRWLVLLELAVGATVILNPYGMDLLIHTMQFSGNPNLNDVAEWFRLKMATGVGVAVGFSWLLLLVLFRHSRARVTPTDVLLLVVFTLAVCLRIRMVTWYAPVVVLVLMPHLADVTDQLRSRWGRAIKCANARPEPLTARSFRYTFLCGLIIWLSFAFAPIGRTVLGGKPPPPERVFSKGTPRGISRYLREHPPQGQIANPQWWGDWLVWDGPPDLQVFMTTNAIHVAPRRVWTDYMALARGEAGLERRLDHYRINTIVVHKQWQTKLARTVRKLDGWKIMYEDDIGFVANRLTAGETNETVTTDSNPRPGEP